MDKEDRFSQAPVLESGDDRGSAPEAVSRGTQKVKVPAETVGSGFSRKLMALSGMKSVRIAVSVLIAFGLWYYVIGGVNPTITKTFSGVAIEPINEGTLTANGLAITGMSQLKTQTVSVELSGKRADLIKIDQEKISVYVDLASVTEGDNFLNVTVNLPANTELGSVDPERIRVHAEKLVTEQRDVRVTFDGSATGGLEPHYTALSAETVNVKGAESQVAEVSYIAAEVKTSDLEEDTKDIEVSLTPMDEEGRKVSDITLSQDNVTVSAQLFGRKAVKLEVSTTGSPAEGYEVESVVTPPTVVIAGPADSLEEVEELSAKPVDISGLSKTTSIDIDVILSDDVVVSDQVKSLEAVINIRESENRETSTDLTYEASSVEPVNVPEGMSAEIAGGVTLTVTGEESAVGTLSASDFTVTADCSGLSEGTATVKASVSYSDAAKAAGVTVNTPSVEVILQKD